MDQQALPALGDTSATIKESEGIQTSRQQDNLQKKENKLENANGDGSNGPKQKRDLPRENPLTGKGVAPKVTPLSLSNFKIKVQCFKCSVCGTQFTDAASCITHVNSHKKIERDAKLTGKKDAPLVGSENGKKGKLFDGSSGTQGSIRTSSSVAHCSERNETQRKCFAAEGDLKALDCRTDTCKKEELPVKSNSQKELIKKNAPHNVENEKHSEKEPVEKNSKKETNKKTESLKDKGKDISSETSDKATLLVSDLLLPPRLEREPVPVGRRKVLNACPTKRSHKASKSKPSAPTDVRFATGVNGSCDHFELETPTASGSGKNVPTRTIIVLDGDMNDKYKTLARAARPKPKRKIVRLPEEPKDVDDEKMKNVEEITKNFAKTVRQSRRKAHSSASKNISVVVSELNYDSDVDEEGVESCVAKASVQTVVPHVTKTTSSSAVDEISTDSGVSNAVTRTDIHVASEGKSSVPGEVYDEFDVDARDIQSELSDHLDDENSDSDLDYMPDDSDDSDWEPGSSKPIKIRTVTGTRTVVSKKRRRKLLQPSERPVKIGNISITIKSAKKRKTDDQPMNKQPLRFSKISNASWRGKKRTNQKVKPKSKRAVIIRNRLAFAKESWMDPKYVCRYCRTEFASLETCKLHMSTEHGTDDLEIRAEPSTKGRPTLYAYSKKRKSYGGGMFRCPWCKKRLLTLETCYSHMVTFHGRPKQKNMRKSGRLAKRKQNHSQPEAKKEEKVSEPTIVRKSKRLRQRRKEEHEELVELLEECEVTEVKETEVPASRKVKFSFKEGQIDGIKSICDEMFKDLHNSKAIAVPKTKKSYPSSKQGIFLCSRCLGEFRSQKECADHMRSTHDFHLEKDDSSESDSDSSSDDSSDSVSGTKCPILECSKCQVKFSTKEECSEHFSVIHNYKVVFKHSSRVEFTGNKTVKVRPEEPEQSEVPERVKQEQMLEKLKRFEERQDHMYHKQEKQHMKLRELFKQQEMDRIKLMEDRQDHLYCKRDKQHDKESKKRMVNCGIGDLKCEDCSKYSKGVNLKTYLEIISRVMKKRKWLKEKNSGREVGKPLKLLGYHECFVCKDTYKYYTHFKRHLAGHDEIACRMCGMEFDSLQALHFHAVVHNCGPLKCDKCTETFYSTRPLVTHILSHEDIFRCDICNRSMRSVNSLQKHKVAAHSGKKFQCEQCEFSSYFKFQMDSHLESTHGTDKKYKCHLCGARYKHARNLEMHLPIHEKKVFICKKCGCWFRESYQLSLHMRRIHNVTAKVDVRRRALQSWQKYTQKKTGLNFNFELNVFVCTVCGEALDSKPSYEEHVKECEEKNSFKCDQCELKFFSHRRLKNHKQEHKKLALMNGCQACGRVFFSPESLVEHVCTKKPPAIAPATAPAAVPADPPAAPAIRPQQAPTSQAKPWSPRRHAAPPRRAADPFPQSPWETPGHGQWPSWTNVHSQHQQDHYSSGYVSPARAHEAIAAPSTFNVQPFTVKKRPKVASYPASVSRGKSPRRKKSSPVRRHSPRVHRQTPRVRRQSPKPAQPHPSPGRGRHGNDGQDLDHMMYDYWGQGHGRMTERELHRLLDGDFATETSRATDAVANL